MYKMTAYYLQLQQVERDLRRKEKLKATTEIVGFSVSISASAKKYAQKSFWSFSCLQVVALKSEIYLTGKLGLFTKFYHFENF